MTEGAVLLLEIEEERITCPPGTRHNRPAIGCLCLCLEESCHRSLDRFQLGYLPDA